MQWPAYTKPESDKLFLKYEINQNQEDITITSKVRKILPQHKIIKTIKKLSKTEKTLKNTKNIRHMKKHQKYQKLSKTRIISNI